MQFLPSLSLSPGHELKEEAFLPKMSSAVHSTRPIPYCVADTTARGDSGPVVALSVQL